MCVYGLGRGSVVGLRRGLVLICACGFASACNFAPHYTRPTTEPAPPAYQETAGWKTAQPADAGNRGAWWAIFNDERLDALENQVTVSNQNIKAAFARLQQARAQTRIERSYLFPTLTAGARGSKEISNTPPDIELIRNVRVQREIIFGRRLGGAIGG